MRWKDAVFDAAVIHVHTEGTVDVVYDVDGTVGIFLTAAEHGLNKLPEKEKPRGGGGKKKKKVCSVEGCPNKVNARGLCANHYRKPCSIDGCTTKAVTRGLCTKHGAKGKCLVGSCSANARNKGGFCARHGGKDGFCAASKMQHSHLADFTFPRIKETTLSTNKSKIKTGCQNQAITIRMLPGQE